MAWSRHNLGRWLLALVCVAVACWLILPTLIVVPLSFTDQASFLFPPRGWSTRFYRALIEDRGWTAAIWNSISVALTVTLIASVLGTLAAVGIRRLRGRAASAVWALSALPLIVPEIVTAIAVYIAFLQLHLTGTFWGFVLAHTVLALPFPMINVYAGLDAIDERLLHAARSLGATRTQVFRKVTLKLIESNILSGALYAFMISFDDVVVGLFIQDASFRTLPVEMYISVTANTDPRIAVAATLIMVISSLVITLLLLARSWHLRRIVVSGR